MNVRTLFAAAICVALSTVTAFAQPAGADEASKPTATGPQPFGANLFIGNFSKTREDGINPDYVVMPGDRVQVNTWGTVDINNVFTVDTQGNIFLPGVGPVRLGGVHNKDLTRVVSARIARVFRRFEVYTNLLTTAPVAVYVTGAVAKPGRYAGVPSDSALFFLDEAGGIDPNLGSYREIVVLRGGKPLATIDLYAFILDGTLPDVQFADNDTILVKRRGPVITLAGEVSTSSLIEFKASPIQGDQALAIIPKAANATAVTVSGTRGGKPYVRTFSIREFAGRVLEDGDTIEFRDDGHAENILVRLEGEFLGSSVLSINRGSRLVDVLNHVRVNPKLADVASIHLKRKSVAESQKQAIEDSLIRLERSSLLATSATEKEASIRVQEAQLMQAFIKSARSIQPLGRVVTTVRGHQLNMLLRDGDVIVIPAISNVVQISGEVQMAHAVAYGGSMRVKEYVARAGGFTERSNQDKVIIMHASAAITIGGPDTLVRQGDTILVPPKIERKLLQNAADVTQVLYQIAVAAAVVLAI